MQGELKQMANLVLFARIVQTGGISRCAAHLGLDRATVSRRLAELERDLGVKLLDRATRRVAITEAGKLCFERCEQLIEIAKDAQAVATTGKMVVDGEPIAVGAPPDIIGLYLRSKLTQFEAVNPGVIVRSYPISRWTEETFTTVDLTIGWEGAPNSAALVRKLTGVKQSVYASPDYLAQHGSPKSPEEIGHHSCIVDSTTRRNLIWKFEGEFDRLSVSIKHTIEVSGMLEAKASTISGLGLGQLPDYLCRRNIEEGSLIAPLSEYTATPRALLLSSPLEGVAKPRTTMLRMFLEDAFATDSL